VQCSCDIDGLSRDPYAAVCRRQDGTDSAATASLGGGRQGGFGGHRSGDIFIAFSTGNPNAWSSDSVTAVRMVTNDRISPLFQATAQATEAAITNALLAAETTTGANDLRIYAMPVDRMMAAMRKYGRIK